MTTTATDNRTEAKRLFYQFTGSTGIIDRLYGPAQAPNRAAIVSALLGKRIPKSNPQAGWNRFRRGMLNLYDIDGSNLCHAEEDHALEVVACDSPNLCRGCFCEPCECLPDNCNCDPA